MIKFERARRDSENGRSDRLSSEERKKLRDTQQKERANLEDAFQDKTKELRRAFEDKEEKERREFTRQHSNPFSGGGED